MMCVINILRLLIMLIIGSAMSAAAAVNYRQHAFDQPGKRPFCNAFTGCGRKRSDPGYVDQPPMSDRMAMEQLDDVGPVSPGDKLGDLIDLNSEPAVEDLMRQIMSQAKLWEAIQEANRDLEKSNKGVAVSFSAQ